MIRQQILLELVTCLVAALLCTLATAAPKRHVQEQDVTLDEENGDSPPAPKKTHPKADTDDTDDTDEGGKPKAAVREGEEEEHPAPARAGGAPRPGCHSDLECDGRAVCRDGKCVDPNTESDEEAATATAGPSLWWSLGLVGDAMFISGSDVCTEHSQVSGGFTCIRGSGSQYHGTPIAGAGGSVSGISFAPLRVTLGVSARLSRKVSAGVRLGYAVLGQGPQPDGGNKFLAFSAEAQGAWWLSNQAFGTKNIGTFVEISAGIAEVDGHSKVTVRENTMVPPPVSQLDNPPQQSLDAYQKAGAGFGGAGVGFFLPFGQRVGLVGDLRVLELFPSSGTVVSLGVSGAFGI